jgi:hypothetical protein
MKVNKAVNEADLSKDLFLANQVDFDFEGSPNVKLIMPSDPRPMNSY